MAYEESIASLKTLADQYKQNNWSDVAIVKAIDDLKFAQRQDEQFNTASKDARLSLAQEIATTLRHRGYWVPDDIMSADLISAVGQAVSSLWNLAEYILKEEIPMGTKPKDLVLRITDSTEQNNNIVKALHAFVGNLDKQIKLTEGVVSVIDTNTEVNVMLETWQIIASELHKILDQQTTKSASSNMNELRDVVQGAMAVVNAMAQAEAHDDFMALKPECIKLNEAYDKLPEINKLLNTKQG